MTIENNREWESYAALLIYAIRKPNRAFMLADKLSGSVDDFRILRLLQQIGKCHAEKQIIDYQGLMQSIQGADLQEWFDKRVISRRVIPSVQKMTDKIADSHVEAVKQFACERKIKTLEKKAKEALSSGREDEYLNMLAEQQELRRRIKTITF